MFLCRFVLTFSVRLCSNCPHLISSSCGFRPSLVRSSASFISRDTHKDSQCLKVNLFKWLSLCYLVKSIRLVTSSSSGNLKGLETFALSALFEMFGDSNCCQQKVAAVSLKCWNLFLVLSRICFFDYLLAYRIKTDIYHFMSNDGIAPRPFQIIFLSIKHFFCFFYVFLCCCSAAFLTDFFFCC